MNAPAERRPSPFAARVLRQDATRTRIRNVRLGLAVPPPRRHAEYVVGLLAVEADWPGVTS